MTPVDQCCVAVAVALVTVRFSRLREFVIELQARGPTLKPLVRVTRLLQPGRFHGRLLTSQELVVHASYLRRTDTVAQLVMLEYVASAWHYVPEPDADTERRAAQVCDLVCAVARAAGLEVARGRYATPADR